MIGRGAATGIPDLAAMTRVAGVGVGGFELEKIHDNEIWDGGCNNSEGTGLVPLGEGIVVVGEWSRTSEWGSPA
jgi:hypothetical protein